MDVTFREFEPYYTKLLDLDPFLEEFSSVTDGDSREGENEGAAAQKEEVIVGAIPCPMNVSEVQEEVDLDNAEDMRSGEMIENGEMTGGDEGEEMIVKGGEEVIVAMNPPCLVENRETVAKEPIVYRRRMFRSQGEQVGTSQLQQSVSSVPNLSSILSPLSSLGPSGNVPSTPEHVELPLAQRRDTRSNFGKPLFAMDLSILVQIMTLLISSHTLVSHLHIEHLLHHYKQCLFQGTGSVQNRTLSERQQWKKR